MLKLLVVDDDDHIRESLELYLKEKGYEVFAASNGNQGLSLVDHIKPHIVILDIRLPDINGLDLLKTIKTRNEEIQVIMITAFQDMETTILATKCGACEYIHKPIDIDELDLTIQKIKNIHFLKNQIEFPIREVSYQYNNTNDVIIGKSNAMKEVFKVIGLISDSKASILIQGESGTGKDLIAKVIHNTSPFKNEPFIPISCSALPETLLESELFGYEKGAFTGAISAKRGKFELAREGTIFLDEIGEISPSVQIKLLRFLQDKEVERLGSEKKILSNARIIAATNKNLADLVNRRGFREDLYFRLRVITIDIPPLRERKEDIPLLVEYFVNRINRGLHKSVTKIPRSVMDSLIKHDWPGNVRELENVLTRAILLTKGKVLLHDCVTDSLRKDAFMNEENFQVVPLREMERKYIVKVLKLADWNKGKACEILGITRPTLRHKMKLYGIAPP
jgi:two-component system response regulator AtoC